MSHDNKTSPQDLVGPAGNYYDKYRTRNPIARYLQNGFVGALTSLLDTIKFSTVQEFGCGEGHLASIIAARYKATINASDASDEIIAKARRENGDVANLTFAVKSIYQLDPAVDSADLIVCCEVMEHLERPSEALAGIARLDWNYLLLSVPHEPLWRVLNLARGKYIRDLGNTPGHVQHWTRRGFREFVSQHMTIKDMRTPTPWTMVLCEKKK